jgi:hypothetical protein
MMWQILHRWFGWDYVHLANSATEKIRRVRFTASGEPYVVYFGEHLVFLRNPGTWTVTYLTLPARSEKSSR